MTSIFGQDTSQSEKISRSQEVPKSIAVGRRAEESQIKFHSPHPVIKAHFKAYSNDLREQVRRLLGLFKSDDWQVRYEVFLHGTGDNVHSGVDIIPSAELSDANQFTISLHVKIHDRFKEENYRLALIKMLLLEQMLGAFLEDPNSFNTISLNPPDWMVHGFDHNLRHKELGRPSYFYSGFLNSGQLMNVTEIMKPNRAQGLNPLSLEVFRASSAVLVGALCDQKDGGSSLIAMLQDMALKPDSDPQSLLLKHFPAFRETGQGIDKWWALQLATLSQQQSFEYYSASQTEEALAKLLEISFEAVPSAAVKPVGSTKAGVMDRLKEKMQNRPDEAGYQGDIARYREFIGRAGAKELIVQRQFQIQALKIKAFPLYRDPLDRYAAVCEKLAAGKFENVDKELAELAGIRQRILKSLEQTRDYLNYYEATRSPQRSQAFDSYLKFKESTQSKALPKRTDAISTYLDKMEDQMPLGINRVP